MSHDTHNDRGLLARLRRPEYTGENRCLPCTAVNVAIALGGAAVLVALGQLALAAVALVAAFGAIWLRGYLVPGTPELTKRYLPERVLRLFGKAPAPVTSTDIDAESYLLSADVVTETVDGTDLEFAPWFVSAWADALDEMRHDLDDTDDVDALAAITGVDRESLSISWGGGAAFAFADDERIGHWESRPAFLADVAANRVLTEHLDGWDALTLAARSEVLGALRLFVEDCPACAGPVALEERVVESCCTRYDVVAGRCTACDARLFEMRLPSAAVSEAEAAAGAA